MTLFGRPRSAWRSGAFWKAQSPSARLRLLGGVFFTFAAVGFLGSVVSVKHTWSPLGMIWNAAYSGLWAVALLYGGLRGGPWRFIVIITLLVATLFGPQFGIPTGDLFSMPPGPSPPLGRIRLGTIGALVSIAAAYVMFITFIRRDGERHIRLRTEVNLAKALHDRLAPPIEMESERYEFLGRALPSSEVAGDLLDVTGPLTHPVAYVADVTGHGIGAGTIAAMVKSAMRMGLLSRSRLEEVLTDLNHVLCQLDRPGLFVTCAAIALEPAGRARVALAGHLPVLLIPAGGGPVRRVLNGAPPLGVEPEERITSEDVACARGDLLALVTDGITEVVNSGQQEFGLERVEGLLRENVSRPLAEIADRVFEAIRAYGAQQDDQTLLLVRVR